MAPSMATPQINSSPKLPIKRKPSNPDPVDQLDEDDDLEPHEPNFPSQPFKFHRIWSESEEIRFLQGLLACSSQGLVFPRDLNLFFDRFSESMPQPYTRSQLHEKHRRLRRKFRTVSARLSRGLDPSRLAPHDRDLLNLSTRLWHPSSSPFIPPSPPHDQHLVPAQVLPGFDDEKPLLIGREGDGHLAAKTVMNALDDCVKEVRAALESEITSKSNCDQGDLARRWRAQRVLELDVLARRWRLVVEHALQG
ncbi:hypothetical protein J5N97_007015 [Dioscorea zingiberensis]|uniref:Glabrous enhancer-binding protein-like DBD domain-containing protein n=1 Tax=Dioscorea zingiberensis TaxID=325984 RepID=A0A9D5DCG8_9LILI|nr:hypothetical protein J5N97_007015 [Dioscorea zingiberensis]